MTDRLVGYCLRLEEVSLQVMRRIGQEISSHLEEGMSPAQFILMRLVGRKGTATVSELSDAMGVTLSAVTSLADRLSASGYLARERDEADRRLVFLKLTTTGEQRFKELEAKRVALIRRHLGQLPVADAERLLAILERLAAIMAETPRF